MLVEMIKYKVQASSILESIVAALVILCSFSAGMVLYHKTLHSNWSGTRMTAEWEQARLADSLAHAPEPIDQQIWRTEIRYEVTFVKDERFEGLYRLRIIAYDQSDQQLSELNRLIYETEH